MLTSTDPDGQTDLALSNGQNFLAHLAQSFQRRSRLKVWTDDGGFPYYKLPQSLRLRGAKNKKAENAQKMKKRSSTSETQILS